MASNSLDKITSLFQVHQLRGVCKTPTTISLLVLSLWVPVGICSLICGSNIFRSTVSRIKKQPDEHIESINRFYQFTSLFGSFFLQTVVWTVVQSQLLVDDNTDNSISNLYWVWLIRPLPSTFVLFMAYICPTLFLENALEMQFVEGVTGMFTIGIYDEIRNAVESATNLSTEQVGNEPLRSGLHYIRHGARLGFAFWILSFFVALGSMALVVLRASKEKALDCTPLRLWTGWSIIFNLMRMIAGFLIFAGVATADDGVFCPNLAATGSIAAISFASTLVDHGWRAFFHTEGVGFKSLSSIVQAPLLASYRKAPSEEEAGAGGTQGTTTRRSSTSYSIRSTFMQHEN